MHPVRPSKRLCAASLQCRREHCGRWHQGGSEIDSLKLIDQHYGSLARLAMDTDPSEILLTPAAEAAFEEAYGTPWSDALGSMMTNPAAMASLGVDGLALESLWRGGKDVKLAPGTYIAQLTQPPRTAHRFTPLTASIPQRKP